MKRAQHIWALDPWASASVKPSGMTRRFFGTQKKKTSPARVNGEVNTVSNLKSILRKISMAIGKSPDEAYREAQRIRERFE